MKQSLNVKNMTIAAMLSAIGIIIPLFSPIKILIEPASFTLASHVPIIIAMFISPIVAIFVSIITCIGFLLNYPTVVVLRASTHIIFATIGALILKKNNKIMLSAKSAGVFAFFISLIHAVCEVAIVTYFYYINGMPDIYKQKGYFVSVFLLVGVGTVIHSMIDFTIAAFVWKPLQNVVSIPVSAKVRVK